MDQQVQPSKNVLIITALTGFIRAFLLDDIKILQEMGYQVDCIANSSGDDLSYDENVRFLKDHNAELIEAPFSSSNPLSGDNFTAYRIVRKKLREKKYDLIHIHTPIPGFLCRLAAIPVHKNTVVVYTTHGFYFHRHSSKKNWLLFYTIEKLASAFGDGIITINREDYSNAKKMFSPNVYYIHGVGVDTKRFSGVSIDRNAFRKNLGIAKEDIAILSVGELSHRKNHQIVIRALKKLNDTRVVYLICGKIEENSGTYSELKALAEKEGVRVQFLGYRRDIPELAYSSDIGALPSSREGLGLAGIEMLAAGLPLAASNVHGIVDYVIDGVTGFTADPYDVDSFAAAIRKLCSKETRERMRDACIRTAAGFDISVSHAERKEIYEELFQGHSKDRI